MFSLTKINPIIQKLAHHLQRQFPTAEVFLVGGIVRDLLLGQTAKDYDLLVRNVPAKKLAAFLAAQGRVDLVGKNFGVFKFRVQNPKSKIQSKTKNKNSSGLGTRPPATLPPIRRMRAGDSGLSIDVALPRTEHSLHQTGGYRDFKVQSDCRLPLATDLSRRDFTVNALAYNLITRELIDPFGGLADLKNKIIRAVGDPELRFKEDYSRLLRAIRFGCQLNFTIKPKTWAALKKLAPKINQKLAHRSSRSLGVGSVGGIEDEYTVPRETIAKELLKAFYHQPVMALELLDQSGLLKQLMPETLKMKGCPQPDNWHSEGDVWQHTVLCLKNLSNKKFKNKFSTHPSINLIIALLFHDLGKPYTIQTPERHGSDRIRFNEHDTLGANLAKTIGERLKLSAYKDATINCDPDKVAWLIAKHMLTVHGRVAEMKNTTIEKYFFSANPGQDLLQLIFVDALSTIPAKGEVFVSHFTALNKRIKTLAKMGAKKQPLPQPLLDGNEIMKVLKIKPGPEIGKIILQLREEQLKGKIKTKAGAKDFIKELTLKNK